MEKLYDENFLTKYEIENEIDNGGISLGELSEKTNYHRTTDDEEDEEGNFDLHLDNDFSDLEISKKFQSKNNNNKNTYKKYYPPKPNSTKINSPFSTGKGTGQGSIKSGGITGNKIKGGSISQPKIKINPIGNDCNDYRKKNLSISDLKFVRIKIISALVDGFRNLIDISNLKSNKYTL